MHNPQIWALLAHTIPAVSQSFVCPARASLWVLGACDPQYKEQDRTYFARCCFRLRAAVQGARLVEDMQGDASGGMEPLPASVREWATAAALTHMRFGTNLETQQHLGPARPGFHALSCRFVREPMSCMFKLNSTRPMGIRLCHEAHQSFSGAQIARCGLLLAYVRPAKADMHSALVMQAFSNTSQTKRYTRASHTDMHEHHLAYHDILQIMGSCTHAPYGMYAPFTGAPFHDHSPHHNPYQGPGRGTTIGAHNEHFDFTHAHPHVDRSTCMCAQATSQIA